MRTVARPHPRHAMRNVVAASVALVVISVGTGGDDIAWALTAAVLVLACVVACTVAALQSRRTDRDVDRAVARLAVQRAARPGPERIRRRDRC